VLKVSDRVLIRLAPFGVDLALSIYNLAAPLVLIELKASPIEVGLVGTIASSVHMGMSHFTGRLSDRLGRRRLITAAPHFLFISCLVMMFTKDIVLIVAVSALNGLYTAVFWPPFSAWIADRPRGPKLARNIGSVHLSWTAAILAGPIISGFLYSLYPRLPFLFGAMIALALFFLLWTSAQEDQPQTALRNQSLDSKASISQSVFLYAAWVACFAFSFTLGNMRYQFPKLARELNVPPQMIGILLGLIGFSMFWAFFMLRKGEHWHFRKRYLIGAQLLSAAGISLILLSSNRILFALAFVVIGFSGSVTLYSGLYYTVYLIKMKGKGAGVYESIVGAGALSGPILGGIAAQFAGLRAPYLLCLVVLFVAVIVEIGLLKRNNTSATGSRNKT